VATLTIRNVPDDVVERLKARAKNKGHSMEQEVRELLSEQYLRRLAVLDEIKESWKTMPPTPREEIDSWIREGRGRPI
jgi:hypothetical protein